MIRAGLMRERVIVQAPKQQRSTMGEATITYETIATVYAQVEGLSTRELLQAMQANVIASYRIRIRLIPGLTHEHRIIWRDRTMEISSVLERDVRTVHELLVKEVV